MQYVLNLRKALLSSFYLLWGLGFFVQGLVCTVVDLGLRLRA